MPKNHPLSNEIREIEEIMLTMRQSKLQEISCVCYISQIESRSIKESLNDHLDIRHHFIHNLVEDKVISLEVVSLEVQIVVFLLNLWMCLGLIYLENS